MIVDEETRTNATWYDSAVRGVALLKLFIAIYAGAGSHVFTYQNGILVSDAWTLFGVTRTKNYGNDGTNITTVSDWV